MPTPRETFPEYAVQTADLTRLTRACDQTGDLRYANLSIVEQRGAFIAHGQKKLDPLQHKTRDELNMLRIPLLEEEERFKAKRILFLSQRPNELDMSPASSNLDKESTNSRPPISDVYNDMSDYNYDMPPNDTSEGSSEDDIEPSGPGLTGDRAFSETSSDLNPRESSRGSD